MIIEQGGISCHVICEDINEELCAQSVVKKYMCNNGTHTWGHEIMKNERGINRYSVRLHINFYTKFISKCIDGGVPKGNIRVSSMPVSNNVKCELPMYPKWISREHQKIAIDRMGDTSHRSFLLKMGTGRGKTYCLLRSISNIGVRMILFARPKYLEKWTSDIDGMYDIPSESIISVQGRDDLDGVISNKGGVMDNANCLVMSNATYSAYISRCKKGTETSGVMPEDLMEHLGIGAIGVDEADEHYYAAFIMAMNSNVQKIFFVTATLKSTDRFVQKIFDMSFKREESYEEKRSSKHINVIAISYAFSDKRLAKTKGYKGMYSHGALEKSILSNRSMLSNYLKMIVTSVGDWISKGTNGKLIIYAYTKIMCSDIVKAIKNKYQQYDTRRFVGGDPYENIIEPDIIVSTISSGGRAMDIPGLTGVLLTISVDSATANDQVSGRLREPSDGSSRWLYYIYCNQIPVHIKYGRNRRQTLAPKIKSSMDIMYAFTI